MFRLEQLSSTKVHSVSSFSSLRDKGKCHRRAFFRFFPMEFNFQAKIRWQGKNDNERGCSDNIEFAVINDLSTKNFFQNQAGVARMPQLFRKKVLLASNTFSEFTEKVQAWKLFSDKTLFSG